MLKNDAMEKNILNVKLIGLDKKKKCIFIVKKKCIFIIHYWITISDNFFSKWNSSKCKNFVISLVCFSIGEFLFDLIACEN